ncbi:unnamed protein product [Trichogramma brassicae]|uniref:RNA-directed DNA polymerase n=1 Tax=Trichogramma brassicae TaxID=86971 RepID=A0A6H5I549_9HYME|nr:unnamed protein product [Trichogramma brassicae]
MPGETLPGTSTVQHRITTTDDDLINVKQYKYPHALKDEVNKQVQEMLDSDVIERSESPYNNPLWIVEKKPDSEGNKRWRIVLDFRALNDKTISDAYPLPNITEIFDQVGSAKYYSVLDLAWGFWQIRLDPRDAHKCAFSTPFGHYQFIRMPFGLKNARPRHFNGKSNVNADSLSRNVPEESNDQALCVVTRSKDKEPVENEKVESPPVPPAPKRGRPPKHLQKPKPTLPPRDTDKRQTKQTEKYDPSPVIKPPEPDPRTFNTPPSESENSSKSEHDSSGEEDQSPPKTTTILPENISPEPSQIENPNPPVQVSEEDATKSTIDIVYSKDLMHCVAENIAYLIDTNGNPLDAGATKLHEFHKLPTLTDLSVGDVLVHNTKRKKNHFALCLKNENPLAPSSCKANLETLFSTLKELLKKMKVEKLFVTKTEHLFGLQWNDIVNLMAKSLEGHQLKLIICTGNLTYVSPEQRDEIFAELHNSAIGGHRGVSKTYNRIKRKYHWENLKNDVHRRIQQCLDCQLKKLVRLKTRQPMSRKMQNQTRNQARANNRNNNANPMPPRQENEVAQPRQPEPQQQGNWRELNAPHYHAATQAPRSNADKRRARRQRRNLYGRMRPQNHLPREAGPPAPNQEPVEQGDAWLAEYVKNLYNNNNLKQQVKKSRCISNAKRRKAALQVIRRQNKRVLNGHLKRYVERKDEPAQESPAILQGVNPIEFFKDLTNFEPTKIRRTKLKSSSSTTKSKKEKFSLTPFNEVKTKPCNDKPTFSLTPITSENKTKEADSKRLTPSKETKPKPRRTPRKEADSGLPTSKKEATLELRLIPIEEAASQPVIATVTEKPEALKERPQIGQQQITPSESHEILANYLAAAEKESQEYPLTIDDGYLDLFDEEQAESPYVPTNKSGRTTPEVSYIPTSISDKGRTEGKDVPSKNNAHGVLSDSKK